MQQTGVPRQQAIDILRKTCNPDLEAHNVLNAWSTVQNAPIADDGTVQRRPRQRRSDAKTPAPDAIGNPSTPSNQPGSTNVTPARRGAGRPPKNSQHNMNRVGGQGRTSITSMPLATLEYNDILNSAGYSSKHTMINVKNLASNALVGIDLWGGEDAKGRSNRFQPIMLSIGVAMRDRFDAAARNDRLDDGTVNYSTLSKAVLKVLKSRGADRNDPSSHLAGWPGIEIDWSLQDLLDWTFVYLTGRKANGSQPDAASAHMYIRDGCPCLGGPMYERPLLEIGHLQELEMSVMLPKGTLLSEGVELTVASGYLPGNRVYHEAPYRATLKLHNIRIPTLIGLNPNERTAKQMVICSVSIDPYCVASVDYYAHLEEIIVKSLEESAFETLESLAIHLTSRVIKHFVFPFTTRKPFPTVTIELVKPSATTFADAPVVTVSRSSDPEKDALSKALWDEWLSWNTGADSRLPFPYNGRLDDWITNKFPGDGTMIGNGEDAGTMGRNRHRESSVQEQQVQGQGHPQELVIHGAGPAMQQQQQLGGHPQQIGQQLRGAMEIDMNAQHVGQMNGQQMAQMGVPQQMQHAQMASHPAMGGGQMGQGNPFGEMRS